MRHNNDLKSALPILLEGDPKIRALIDNLANTVIIHDRNALI